MIVDNACTLNGLLSLTLALACVISYEYKWRHKLQHHLLTILEVLSTIVMCL